MIWADESRDRGASPGSPSPGSARRRSSASPTSSGRSSRRRGRLRRLPHRDDGRRAVSEPTAKLFADDRYQEYLHLHGLGVEMAEALAELWHHRIRAEWGFVDEDGPSPRRPVPPAVPRRPLLVGLPRVPRPRGQRQGPRAARRRPHRPRVRRGDRLAVPARADHLGHHPATTPRPSTSSPAEVEEDPGWRPPVRLWLVVAPILLVVSAVVDRRGDIEPADLPVVPLPGRRAARRLVPLRLRLVHDRRRAGLRATSRAPSRRRVASPSYSTRHAGGRIVVGDVTLAGVLRHAGRRGSDALLLYWRSGERLVSIERAAVVALRVYALYPYAWYLYGRGLRRRPVPRRAPSARSCSPTRRRARRRSPPSSTATRAVGIDGRVRPGRPDPRTSTRRRSRRVHRSGSPRRLGVLLGCRGLVGVVAYLWLRFDDPFLLLRAAYWGQPAKFDTWIERDFVAPLLRREDRLYASNLPSRASSRCDASQLVRGRQALRSTYEHLRGGARGSRDRQPGLRGLRPGLLGGLAVLRPRRGVARRRPAARTPVLALSRGVGAGRRRSVTPIS